MTIASSNSRNNYVGNGLLSTYQYTFIIRKAEDLRVTLKDPDLVEYPKTLGVDYSVAGVGEADGGSITLTAGNLANGWTISIRRVKAVNQETDLRNQGSYFPETVEDSLDDLAMSDQQQQDEIDRSMKLPETIDPDAFDPILPSELIGSPNRAFGTDPTGTKFSLGPSFGDIQGAAASAEAAAVSEANAADSADAAEVARLAAEVARDAAQLAESGAVAAEAVAASSASNAQSYAGQANTSASNALTSENAAAASAATATTAKNDAVNAKNAAESAQSAAEDAKDDSEAAAAAAQAAVNGFLVVADTNDSSTGAIIALSTTVPDKGSIRLTGAATSLDGLAGGSAGRIVYVINASGSDIPVRHLNSGASSANRINTGSGGDNLSLKNGGIFQFKYDGTSNVWRVSGGAGGASLSTPLTGLASTGNTIADTDSILAAFRKLNNRANAIPENVIANGVAAVDAAGYAAYADAAGIKPVDGTGGSPSLTIGINNSDPLDGSNQFVITKGATNRQGDGIACPFTIKRAQKYKINRISFDYAGALAWSANGASLASPSDLTVWIYDVTNGVLIEPSQSYLDGSGEFISEFQATDSVDYRVLFHVSTTNASTWAFLFTNLKIGRRQIARGPTVSDWTEYPLGSITTSSGTLTNYTSRAWWRRVGDSIELMGRVNFTGAPGTWATPQIPLPSFAKIDYAKMTDYSSSIEAPVVGNAAFWDFGSAVMPGDVYLTNNDNRIAIGFHNDATTPAVRRNALGSTNPVTVVSGDGFQWKTTSIPITGWSSNTVASSDFGNREIYTRMSKTSQSVSDAVATKITLDTIIQDKTASANTANNRIEIKEPGLYLILGTLDFNSSSNFRLRSAFIYVNGSNTNDGRNGFAGRESGNNNSVIVQAFNLMELKAGDYVELYALHNSGGSLTVGYASLAVAKWNTPQTLMGGEKVRVLAANPGGAAITATPSNVPYTASHDTHGAWNGTRFTAPRSDWYDYDASIGVSGTNNSTSQAIDISAFLNGSIHKIGQVEYGNGASHIHNTSVSGGIYLKQGEYLEFRGANSNNTTTLGGGYTVLSITSG